MDDHSEGPQAWPAREGRPSLTFCYALAHKGVPVEFRLVDPLERTLAEQPYSSGAARTYTNYLLFSVFQYARLGCPDEFLAEGTALRRWRDDLALAFDGLGNRYLAYPASLA